MMAIAQDMRALLRSLFTLRPRYDAVTEWPRLIKKTIGRYARGNIAAQNERILLREEQEEERRRALSISQGWKQRFPSLRE